MKKTIHTYKLLRTQSCINLCMCVVVYHILTFVYLHNKKGIALIIILLLFIFFMIALQNLTREATINVLTNLQKAI